MSDADRVKGVLALYPLVSGMPELELTGPLDIETQYDNYWPGQGRGISTTGVYLFFDSEDRLLYVGSSSTQGLDQRITAHFVQRTLTCGTPSDDSSHGTRFVRTVCLPDEFSRHAVAIEHLLIAWLNPPNNIEPKYRSSTARASGDGAGSIGTQATEQRACSSEPSHEDLVQRYVVIERKEPRLGGGPQTLIPVQPPRPNWTGAFETIEIVRREQTDSTDEPRKIKVVQPEPPEEADGPRVIRTYTISNRPES